ncbi:NosD domain-containing protein [Halobacterium litoreum]|uniref:NosD domain-containing protein n=1 Tax=Halobacterium litoreum TaxID=2039234 RepID=A0ABD5NF12_9EURY|nr:NosD domain-containing protein [Halobacterium litoreum]UHH13442.1 right-handed parallel beta-helix repeat-containing protein [Halobacterium litoreum]
MAARELLAVLAVVLALLSYSLALPVSGGEREPAPFDDTLQLGLTSAAVQEARERGVSVPRVQAYYSGFEYAVGYYGVEAFLEERARTGHERQFGSAVELFVSDYAGTNVSLTDAGYLKPTRFVGFEPASETVVVVGSRARSPGGPVAVPFSDESAAAAFADEYGGSVVPWSEVAERVDAERRLTTERFRSAVANASGWADERVADARTLRDRPTSVVVGEDAPTLEAAVAAAPPNTTVELPAGTYETGGVTVNKSITVSGVGPETRVVGDGNGTVFALAAPRAGLTDLHVAGVGDVGSRRSQLNDSELDVNWSRSIELAYGRGDAAVKLFDASESLVSGVTVETGASGVIVLESAGAVVRDVRVNGTDDPLQGFMGVVAMYDRIVVEDSEFVGGRDGVYTHRADGVVVRDNVFRGQRFGVHEMYTSDALVRNNTASGVRTGVIVMTRPTGNLVVDNVVRDAEVGISTAGATSYYAGNVLADNGHGIDVLGYRSLVERNTIVGNDVGLRGEASLPTNLVTANDVVDNEKPVETDLGALRVWTVDGAGNYWGAMPADDRDGDGSYDRAFRPTGGVDAHIHDAPGAYTLARSPAVAVLREVQSTVPGLREAGVVDTAPRVTPARPDVLAAVRGNETEVAA